jgi:hypothetical protein
MPRFKPYSYTQTKLIPKPLEVGMGYDEDSPRSIQRGGGEKYY